MATRINASSYLYDALDRLAARISAGQVATEVYYCVNTLVTEAQGTQPRRFFRAARRLLAQQNGAVNTLTSALILTDRSNNAMAVATANEHLPLAYSVYGYRQSLDVLPGLPGFNGEHPDPLTGHYLLGNGYRAYNPVLMRFNSADSLSPFGKGGVNTYAYCTGDPVNRSDPSGRASEQDVFAGIWITLGFLTSIIGLATARAPLLTMLRGKAVPWRDAAVAAVGVGGVAGGALWTAAYYVRMADPDAKAVVPMQIIAVGLALPTFVLRTGNLFVSMRSRPAPPPLLVSFTARNSLSSAEGSTRRVARSASLIRQDT